jgi:anthranilate phosphoribosyltransferase
VKPVRKRDIVLINAAAGLVAAQKANNLADGVSIAAQSIDSGKAKEKLEQLAQYTRDNG